MHIVMIMYANSNVFNLHHYWWSFDDDVSSHSMMYDTIIIIMQVIWMAYLDVHVE